MIYPYTKSLPTVNKIAEDFTDILWSVYRNDSSPDFPESCLLSQLYSMGYRINKDGYIAGVLIPKYLEDTITRFDVWSEGCAGTGNNCKAWYLGSFAADSFNLACEKASEKHNMTDSFNKKHLTIWGCRLFNNEAEARQSF